MSCMSVFINVRALASTAVHLLLAKWRWMSETNWDRLPAKKEASRLRQSIKPCQLDRVVSLQFTYNVATSEHAVFLQPGQNRSNVTEPDLRPGVQHFQDEDVLVGDFHKRVKLTRWRPFLGYLGARKNHIVPQFAECTPTNYVSGSQTARCDAFERRYKLLRALLLLVYPSSSLGWRYGANSNPGSRHQPNWIRLGEKWQPLSN